MGNRLNDWINSASARVWDQNGNYVPGGRFCLVVLVIATVFALGVACESGKYLQQCPIGAIAGIAFGVGVFGACALIILSPPSGSKWQKKLQRGFLYITRAMSVFLAGVAIVILWVIYCQVEQSKTSGSDFFVHLIALSFSILLLVCSEVMISQFTLSMISALMTSPSEEQNARAFEYSYCWKAYKWELIWRIVVLFAIAVYTKKYSDCGFFDIVSTGIMLYLGYEVAVVAELPTRECDARRDISEHISSVLVALSSSESYHERLPPLALSLDEVLKKDLLGRPGGTIIRGTITLVNEQTRCEIMQDIDVVIHSPRGFPLCTKEVCPVRQTLERLRESTKQTQDESNFVQSIERLRTTLFRLQKAVQR